MASLDLARLAEDRAFSMDHGIQFSVATKDGKGQQWRDVERGLDDLLMAMERAEELRARHEFHGVAVFVLTEQGSGFFYWNSVHPDLWGSDVLRIV